MCTRGARQSLAPLRRGRGESEAGRLRKAAARGAEVQEPLVDGPHDGRHDREQEPHREPDPTGYRTLTPYLAVPDGATAIAFYQRAFGAEVVSRMDAPGGLLMHAELRIGDSMLQNVIGDA